MRKNLLVIFLMSLLSCNWPAASGAKKGASSAPTTTTTPTTAPTATTTTTTKPAGFKQCHEISLVKGDNITPCTQAKDDKGQLLGCEPNTITGRCVLGAWANKIRKEECQFVSDDDCQNGITFYDESDLAKPAGMCAINDALQCVEIPVLKSGEENQSKKKCVAVSEVQQKQAADELCGFYKQNMNMDDDKRSRLTSGKDCTSIIIDDGKGGHINGTCQDAPHSRFCVGFLSEHADISRRTFLEENPIDKYCDGRVKRTKKAKADFSGLVEVEDYSGCQGAKLFAPKMEYFYNNQEERTGTIAVCILADE